MKRGSLSDPSRALRCAILFGVLLLAGALRFAGLGHGLSSPEDQPVVHPLARPDEHIAWNVGFSIYAGDPNPRFFQYPSLFFYALAGADALYLAAASLAAGSRAEVEAALLRDPRALVWIARGLVAALGTLTSISTYLVARAAFGPRTGLVAAFFLATAYLHVRDSHFGVTDVPLTALACVALLQALRIESRGLPRDALRAGIAAGLAMSTKYTGVALLVPIGAAFALAPRRSPARSLVWLAAALAVFALGFFAATPFAVLAWPEFRADLAKVAAQAQQPWLGVDLGRGWWRHPTFTLWHGLGAPLLLAALAGFVPALRRAPRPALVLAAFAASYGALVGASPLVFARYALPLVPVLCITAAVGVLALADRLPRARLAGAFSLALLLALPSLRAAIDFDRLLLETDSRVLAGRWLREHVEPGAMLLLVGHVFGDPAAAFEGRPAYDPYPWPPTAWADRSPPAPAFRYRRARNDLDPELDAALADERVRFAIVAWSPLAAYGPGHPMRKRFREFRRVAVIQGVGADPTMRFDLQDAFYAPFAGAARAVRPGPNFTLYERVPGGSRRSPESARGAPRAGRVTGPRAGRRSAAPRPRSRAAARSC